MIILKSPQEIEKMRRAGRIVAGTIDAVLAAVRPGAATRELDAVAEKVILDRGAVPSFKGYRGFPASICVWVNEDSLEAGISQIRAGKRLSDIGHAVQQVVEGAGFSVVREYVGHGIGRNLHEDPQIPNYGQPGRGPEIKPGLVVAVEPMVNMGDWPTRVLRDNWTVVTADGSLSAHFEHTTAATENGPEVLTAR